MISILGSIFNLFNLLMMNIGVAVGMLIGAAPGLSVSFAVTILLTTTFNMQSLPAMFMLLGAYCGGMYGGSITAILINTPGTANAVCTAMEGYPLSRKGKGGEAMLYALYGSTFGGIVSCIVLLLFAPLITRLIVNIGAPEYTALCCFGIFASVGLEGTNFNKICKGIMSGAFGLLLACVGPDPIFGTNRFAFGSYAMLSGIKMISAMLGAYALSQVMINAKNVYLKGDENMRIPEVAMPKLKLSDFFKHGFLLIKSALIGSVVGAVPGTGGAEGAMISYNEAKRTSKHPEEYGKGSLEGILAAETANNAVTGGALIPMLTLGIPGDAVMAILLGALTMHGITPGPKLFTSGDPWVYSIIGGIFVINIFMLLQGKFFSMGFAKISKIPQSLMVPCIVVMCMIGGFAISNNKFEVFVVTMFGLLGYLMKLGEYPVTPMCISLVLGQLFENSLRRALLLSKGDYTVFIKRPASFVILLLSVFMMFWPIVSNTIMQRIARKNAQ